tara:strand:+ start:4234 stop:4413 length:180 start_codon:yes stop_codon:yes gene_type:complete
MFIIFAGEKYYPLGGSYDIVSVHDEYYEALTAYDKIVEKYEWIHIFDTHMKTIIKEIKK